MIHNFTRENIDQIGQVLGATPKPFGNDVYRIELKDEKEGRKLALEIHLGMMVKGRPMNMVSVYAANTFLQLHNCTAYAASEMLKQVTFFGKSGGMTSGLIVEPGAACSLYSNVSDTVLQGDFTQLPDDLMMCGVALSLTEEPEPDDPESR